MQFNFLIFIFVVGYPTLSIVGIIFIKHKTKQNMYIYIGYQTDSRVFACVSVGLLEDMHATLSFPCPKHYTVLRFHSCSSRNYHSSIISFLLFFFSFLKSARVLSRTQEDVDNLNL